MIKIVGVNPIYSNEEILEIDKIGITLKNTDKKGTDATIILVIREKNGQDVLTQDFDLFLASNKVNEFIIPLDIPINSNWSCEIRIMIQVSGKISAESEWYDLIHGEETAEHSLGVSQEETKPYTSEFLKEEDTETELAADISQGVPKKESSEKRFDEKEDTEITIVEDEKEKKITTSSWGILIEDGKNATFGVEVESDIVQEEEKEVRSTGYGVSGEEENTKKEVGGNKTIDNGQLTIDNEKIEITEKTEKEKTAIAKKTEKPQKKQRVTIEKTEKEEEVRGIPSTKMVRGERLEVGEEKKEKKTKKKTIKEKEPVEIAEESEEELTPLPLEEEFTQTEAEIIVKDTGESVVSDLKHGQQNVSRQKKKRFPVLLILILIIMISAAGYYFFIVKGIKIPLINREKTVDKTKETDINDLLSTGKDDLLLIEKSYIVETEKLSEDQIGKIEYLIEKYNGNLLEVGDGYKMIFKFENQDNAEEFKTLIEEKEIKCTIKEQ